METKTCKGCLIEKKIGEFFSDPRGKLGVRSRCKSCLQQQNKSNPNIIKNKKAYAQKNRDIINKKLRDKRNTNIDYYREYDKEKMRRLRGARPEHYRKSNNDNSLKRYHRLKNDPIYSLTKLVRSRFLKAVKSEYKDSSVINLLGCSIEELRDYLESKFQEGMNWQNHGVHGWHIDHIKPCASFDFTDMEQQKKCFHYTNLQPLWAKDNLRKGCTQ